MPTFRLRSRRVRLAVALWAATTALAGISHGGVSTTLAAPASAAGVYTAIAGPKYPTSRTLSSYHRLDCSSANPYWANHACTLNIDTQLAGCIWETQSTDNGAAPHSSPCRVTINGPVPWRNVPAYCYLGTTDDTLEVTYYVGGSPGSLLSPIRFYAKPTLAPTAFNGNATATRSYSLKVTATAATATAASGVLLATGTIKEAFAVDFAYPVKDVCPNADNDTLSIGNVRDVRSDVVAQDNATAGFIKADLVTS